MSSIYGELASSIAKKLNSYEGYNPSMQFQKPPPAVVGWSIPDDLSNGFVEPKNYGHPDIICHVGATPAQKVAKVTAGSSVQIFWTTWPESHKGPVMDYLAPCGNGGCTSVDKTTLRFFRIDAVGLLDGSNPPGRWASDEMVNNNNSWTVKIPDNIAPGQYVLRHETIALHSAGQENGAQNYPQCINLDISSKGSDRPAGFLGTELYKPTDPGIKINIYTKLSGYTMPGPAGEGGKCTRPRPSQMHHVRPGC